MEEQDRSTSAVLSSRTLFSRDLNYLRDLVLLWPFAIYTIFAVASLFSPPDRRLGLRFAAVAIAAILLAKEKSLLFFAGLGFIALRCAITLVLHPWSWSVFAAGILAAVPFILANRYWRKPKLAYRFPSEFRLVDALLSITSICVALGLLYVVRLFD